MTATGIDGDGLVAAIRAHGSTVLLDELRGALPAGLSVTELRAALAGLEAQGRLIVRDHYFADPHLEGVDLGVVGLLEPVAGGDAISTCIDRIESTWSVWLAEYLANHRCS